MTHLKYFGYIALTAAVLMDLYAGKPDGDALWRVTLDITALILAIAGLGGLAAGPVSGMRR